jgi:putative phosphoribosyl transferase
MTRFRDRRDAGRRLAALIGEHARDALVVGLPRGGVIVAAEVAAAAGAELDVIVVQKIVHPTHRELALGALGEAGIEVVDRDALQHLGVDDEELARQEALARAELARRVERFRPASGRRDLTDRHVVIVDDGIATGATAQAACRVARTAGAAHITVGVPVAPHGWEASFVDLADDLYAVTAPRMMGSVGRFYRDFTQVGDDEVLACLARSAR